MAGCNIEGLKRVFGDNVVKRIKTCEFHFKQCRNRQYESLVMTTAETLNVYATASCKPQIRLAMRKQKKM